jgi:hypothetical protein
MPLKDNNNNNNKRNHTTTIKKRIILTVIALSLLGLIVHSAAAGLASNNIASAQSIPDVILPPRNNSNSILSNQGIAFPSSPGTFPAQFGPPPPSPELSATQISSSTNKTCTLTPH